MSKRTFQTPSDVSYEKGSSNEEDSEAGTVNNGSAPGGHGVVDHLEQGASKVKSAADRVF